MQNSVFPRDRVRQDNFFVNTDFQVIHEDAAILVVDKPAPLAVHPVGSYSELNLHSLLKKDTRWASAKIHFVHRLDAETSGVILIAKTYEAARFLGKEFYDIDPKDSWVVAACEKNLPIFTPGWEDSTLGNIFVANVIRKEVSSFSVVKSGVEQMAALVDWYKANTKNESLGFFQIGGGIAGDFPICVVPLIQQDLKEKCRLWGYFCQISDSTTSYGSYSGAVPNEKITWGKLDPQTPRFVIESDASIVAPLIFSYLLAK